MSAGDRFVWLDIETTGLNPTKERILEIGFIVTDVEFDLRSSMSWVINPGFELTEANTDPFIWEMHTKSGLIDECNNSSLTVDQAVKDILARLEEWDITRREDPLCGSSVQFDRSFLSYDKYAPILKNFSYRNIDISTIKELCKRLNPELYPKLEKYSVKRELHRAIPDLEDTISEAQFYAENFLIMGD